MNIISRLIMQFPRQKVTGQPLTKPAKVKVPELRKGQPGTTRIKVVKDKP